MASSKAFIRAVQQARVIRNMKTPKGRARAIHRWCDMVRDALRDDETDLPVRGMQPGPSGADLHPGLGTGVRGTDGDAPADGEASGVPRPHRG